MADPAFAVTMTTKNNATTIRRSLESLGAEVRGQGEIVIVDAHSTDGTWEILSEMTATVPELRAISADLNRGLGRSRAVAESRAPIVISQIDADNVYTEGSLRAAARAIAESDDDVLLVEGEFDANPSCTRCYTWKRAAFERIGGYPPIQYEEDLALVQHALRAGLKVASFRVPRLGDDLKPRGPQTAYRLPVHRRLAPVVRTARLFQRLGFSYPEYVRFLWLTRRGIVRFAGASALGAYAFLSPHGPASSGGRGHYPTEG